MGGRFGPGGGAPRRWEVGLVRWVVPLGPDVGTRPGVLRGSIMGGIGPTVSLPGPRLIRVVHFSVGFICLLGFTGNKGGGRFISYETTTIRGLIGTPP